MMALLVAYIAIIIVFLFFIICDAEAYEESVYGEPQFFEVEATAYCDGTTRCDGKPVRQGVCAGKKEWYGKVIALYENKNGNPGEFLGYYECLDTGGDSRIKDGKCVDVYNHSKEWCINFGRKKVLAVIIEGEG